MKLGELQTKLDNSNNIMSAAHRKMLEKLESKLRGLEDELDQERRKSKDHLKHLRQAERNMKDLEYQSFQEKRNSERFEVSIIIFILTKFSNIYAKDIIAKLKDKNRMYKKLAENAEEMAALNLSKLRRAQAEADFEIEDEVVESADIDTILINTN